MNLKMGSPYDAPVESRPDTGRCRWLARGRWAKPTRWMVPHTPSRVSARSSTADRVHDRAWMVIVMSTGSPTVTVPSGVGSASAEDDQRPADQVRIERLPDRRCLPMLVPVLAMFLIGMWRIDRPSFWRDESVTVLVSGQSPADIVGHVRNTDAVHGAYYLLMHLITQFGQSELIARLPSVLAAALAAGGITVIGRLLVSARAGLLAGLIFGLLPVVSRYAQEARSYSIVSAVAVLATYLLLSALATTTGRVTWFAGYAVSVAALGWLHLDAILLVGAHAVVVLVHWRMAGSARPLAWWSGAVVAATAAVLPLLAEARPQSAQVSWLRPPDWGVVGEFATFVAGTTAIAVAVVLVALVGIQLRPASGGLPGVGVVALSWLVVPFAGLVAVSVVAEPSYYPRYLLYCVPAVALLAGAGLDRLAGLAGRFGPPASAWVASLAVLSALAVMVWPTQLAIREPGSRPDNLRALADLLGDLSRDGDSVLYLPANRRVFMTVYADAFTGLDQTRLHTAGRNALLVDDLPTADFRAALGTASRIWVVWSPPPGSRYTSPVPMANRDVLRTDHRFTKTASWRFGYTRLILYAHR
jgi:mannosyltransferase